MRILLDKFTKSFGPLTVIDNMTLEIADGEMLALLGPSMATRLIDFTRLVFQAVATAGR